MRVISAALTLPAVAAEITQIATQDTSAANAGGFSVPIMGTEGRVVFNGYSNSGTKTLTEWTPKGSSGKTSTLLSTNSEIPGTTGKFTGYSNTYTSSVGTAFYGMGDTAHDTWGIYVASPSDTISPVATLGSFASVGYPSIDSTGQVAFTGTKNTQTGMWYASAVGATPELVIQSTHSFPGGPSNASLKCIENTVVNDGMVAFFGSTCDDNGAAVRDADRMIHTKRSCSHALKDQGGKNTGAGVFLTRLDEKGSLETLASTFTTPPGSTQKGETFEAFSAPVIGSEMVAFVASTSAGVTGIYAYTLSTKSLGLVASTETAVPGAPTGTVFEDFPTLVSVSDTSVAFYGAAAGTAAGIYVRTPASSELKPIVTMADQLGGEATSYLGFSSNAFDGKNIAFYGVTTVDGIYTATVPQ